jgi:hypothetical protein
MSCGRALPADGDGAADVDDDSPVGPSDGPGGNSNRPAPDGGVALDGAPAGDAAGVTVPDAAPGPEVPPAAPCPAPPFGTEPQSRAWLAYQANPNTHPNIPNVSYAGYRYGETLLPSPQGPVINVKDHGAKGDGQTDDTAAIRKALEAVALARTGAIVFFPDGTYVISGVLFVHTSRTVLRGQSRNGTRLLFTKPLSSYATNVSPGNNRSRWNWAGGLIWVTPARRNTYVPPGTDLSATFSDSWASGSDLTKVAARAARGDSTITVENGAPLRPGQFVLVRIEGQPDLSLLKHLTGDGTWAERYDWSPQNAGRLLTERVQWPVEIAAVNGNQVTLKQPLRFDLRPEWNGRLQPVGEPVLDSGIESLTLVLQRNYAWKSTTPDTESGWNGLYFNNVINAFVRGITIVDSEIGIATTAVKNLTITDVKINASSADRMDHPHGFLLRNRTSDVLIEGFEIATKPNSGIWIEQFSMGNVWSRGIMQHGTFNSGQVLPNEDVRTEIKIFNDGRPGSIAGQGPHHGARIVNWNVEVTNNVSTMVCEAHILPRGTLVGVRGCNILGPTHSLYGDSQCLIESSGPMGAIPNPRNLYEAQRWLRLCSRP